MNEDLLELKRNLIQYHSNTVGYADDEKPSDEGSATYSTEDEQATHDIVDANIVADHNMDDTLATQDTTVHREVEPQPEEDRVEQSPVANVLTEPKQVEAPVQPSPVANYVTEPKQVEVPVQHNPVANIVVEPKQVEAPVQPSPVANIVTEPKQVEVPVQQNPVANIVVEPKQVEVPVQHSSNNNKVAQAGEEGAAIQQSQVANLVAEPKQEDIPAPQATINNIAAQQNEKERPIRHDSVSEMVVEQIQEEEQFSNIEEDLYADNRSEDLSPHMKQDPSSGELMGTGLRLLWCGGIGFIGRTLNSCKNLLATIWRTIRYLLNLIITSRRPAMEMIIAIPVALFIGYSFKGVNNTHGEVTIPLTPNYSKVNIVQPDVLGDTYKQTRQEITLVPEEAQEGVEIIREDLKQKVSAWREKFLNKVAVLQKQRDIKEAKYQKVDNENSELLVVVKPPKNPLELYQSGLTNKVATVKAEKTIKTAPIFNKPLQVTSPVRDMPAPVVQMVETPAVQMEDAQPVQTEPAPALNIVVEEPVQMALNIPTNAVVERSSQANAPQPVKAPLRQRVTSGMVSPKPLRKSSSISLGVPKPKRKLTSQKQVLSTMATPAPMFKAKGRLVKNNPKQHLQAKTSSPKGFVLFLGSYRQSKAEYLQNITNNLQNEPFDLIKQTVNINNALYTRLYAGPFANRDSALKAKQALFEAQKIDSSVTYLQPGVTKYSRIERSDEKHKSAIKRDYKKVTMSQVGKKYVVRVGSFQNVGVDSSGNLLRKIVSLGGVGFQQNIKVKGKSFWRVYSGPFADIKQANRAKEALKAKLNLPNMLVMSKNRANKWVRISEENRS
ncbi:MAG: SPOR domain-containing protein [Magnetococcales bacterium]|nr:SPOR domain-containing protein [Magnetococcales bacterium]